MFSVRAIQKVSRVSARTFTSSSIANEGILKDLFIKEIKSYKPTANANTSDIAQAKDFKLPTPPQAPTFKEDITADLASYDQASA